MSLMNLTKQFLDKLLPLTEVAKLYNFNINDLKKGGSADFTYIFGHTQRVGEYFSQEDHGCTFGSHCQGLTVLEEKYKSFTLKTFMNSLKICWISIVGNDGQLGKNYVIPYKLNNFPGELFINVLGDSVTSISWRHYNSDLRLPIVSIKIKGHIIDKSAPLQQLISEGKSELQQLETEIEEEFKNAQLVLKLLKNNYGVVTKELTE